MQLQVILSLEERVVCLKDTLKIFLLNDVKRKSASHFKSQNHNLRVHFLS